MTFEQFRKLDLYVASSFKDSSNNNVKRYDGTTGQFLGEFVANGSGGLDHAAGITFGPDGNLYVASGGWGGNGGIFGLAAVLRYEGPTCPDKLPPGTFLGTFVRPGSGGLNSPFSLLFGPDGNGDGHQDLYVSTWLAHGADFKTKNDTSAILCYDGKTGSFIDAFVPFGSPGMDGPDYITFTETDATTLAFATRNDPLSTAAALETQSQMSTGTTFPGTVDSAVLGAFCGPLCRQHNCRLPPSLQPGSRPLHCNWKLACLEVQATVSPAPAHQPAAPQVVIDQFIVDLDNRVCESLLGG